MTSKISSGVKISVETFYQPMYSNPIQNEYMFAYRIIIENHNYFPVKLLNRHWIIFDSLNDIREVQGEGVVGEQPIIYPNEVYKYVSGCSLRSEIGKMKGSYEMENMLTKEKISVSIPPFDLIVPVKYN